MAASQNVLIEYTKWLFKIFAIVLGGIVLIGLVIGGGSAGWYWWSYERHKTAITVSVAAGDAWAPGERTDRSLSYRTAEYPIHVLFFNNSGKTITSLTIDISVYLPGRSTNILDYSSSASFDRVIKPAEGWGSCWRFGVRSEYQGDSDLGLALYRGTVRYVS